jgi:hypothetical protein
MPQYTPTQHNNKKGEKKKKTLVVKYLAAVHISTFFAEWIKLQDY